jgi:sodium transport system ATP-binding protein
MVKVTALVKSFHDPKKGKIEALKGIDFEALDGQVTGLLGVNGAGKTTALRILSTVIKPDSGSASVAGFDVLTHGQQVRERIGFLSNSTSIYGRLSGRECLRYFGELYNLDASKINTRIQEVTDTLRLGDFIDQLCDKLSTGQKQRINIARAILHDPPVLFFDEPTAGLDVLTSQTIMEFIESCRDRGKTVIFSTHIMSEVQRLCDQVSIIHNGTICASGSPSELMANKNATTLEQAFLAFVDYQRGAITA